MKATANKTWQSFFKENGLDPKVLPDVSMLAKEDRAPVIAQYIIQKTIKILNGDWVADYNDFNQLKYEPRFKVVADKKRPSGFGLSYLVCVYWLTFTFCGVRLVYKDLDTLKKGVKLLAKQYDELYLPFIK